MSRWELFCFATALLPMLALLHWSRAPAGNDFEGEL
ncbi:hypothetical protein ABIE45_004565 [Methylobacterium sp. OAE515]